MHKLDIYPFIISSIQMGWCKIIILSFWHSWYGYLGLMIISNVFALKMTKKNLIWIFIFTLACSFQDVTAKHLLDCHEKWSYMPYFLVLANYWNLSSHFDFHLLWIPKRTVSYLTHHCRLWKNKICSFDCLFLLL